MSRRNLSPNELFEAACAGDRAALARVLSLLERGDAVAREVGRLAYKQSGNGYTVGITGAPGAGKSTLVDVILGLLPPSSGELLVDGINLHEQNLEWQSTIGYVAQAIYLTDDTIRRNVAFGIAEKEIDDVVKFFADIVRLVDQLSRLGSSKEDLCGAILFALSTCPDADFVRFINALRRDFILK